MDIDNSSVLSLLLLCSVTSDISAWENVDAERRIPTSVKGKFICLNFRFVAMECSTCQRVNSLTRKVRVEYYI